MNDKYLAISYECLSSIGNSFELESMMAEVVITFYQSTKAVFVGFYESIDSILPTVSAGKDEDNEIKMSYYECFMAKSKNFYIIVLPLKMGYMKFVYNENKHIEDTYNMICNFKKKINFALSACVGVKELEKLNDELEDRVKQSVEKIREHEKMLIVQSKSAIMGEMSQIDASHIIKKDRILGLNALGLF